MKHYTFVQKFVLIGLNGLDSIHASNAKTAVLRGVLAAKFLERQFELLNKNIISEENKIQFQKGWEETLKIIRSLDSKRAKEIEQEITESLKTDQVLEEVPDILACDFNYETAGIELKAYRTSAEVYQCIIEEVRNEILKDDQISAECFGFIWLMRETGCIHEHFSVEEQKVIEKRMIELNKKNSVWKSLWEEEFHNVIEHFIVKFLKRKSEFFKNPYMEGVNLVFPFIERRKAIFIDFVVLGTNVASRRIAIMQYLSERGHYVEEVKNGSETLLKIDNTYYRVFPSAKRIPRAHAIQGAYIVPVYQ